MGTAGQWAYRWGPTFALLAWVALAVFGWVAGQRAKWAIAELLLAETIWLLVLLIVARDAVRNLFGPVFVYELVRVGRRRLTYVLRALYVLGLCTMLGILYLQWLERVGYFNYYGPQVTAPGAISKFATEYFYYFVFVQYAVVCLLTPAYVAGTVADEKERKTLEFLLATDLRNREIIFGKLAARVANLLMLVLAGLPLLAMLQLFGGIDPELVLAATAATVVTLIGLASISIYQSTVVKKPRDAIMLTYLLIGMYVVLTAFAAGYTTNVLSPQGFSVITVAGYKLDFADLFEWLASGNLPYLLLTSAASRRTVSFGPDEVAEILTRLGAFWGIVSTLLILLAIARLRVVALGQSTGIGGIAIFKRKKSQTFTRVRPEIGDDPMFWKEVFVEGGFRAGCGGMFMALILVGLTFIVPAMIVFSFFGDLVLSLLADAFPWLSLRESLPPIWFVGTGYHNSFSSRWDGFVEAINAWVRGATGVIGFLLMLAVAVRGASSVSGEKDRDTWISLISTPLTAQEMVLGKWWGTVLGMRRGYWLLVTVWGCGLVVGAVNPLMVIASVVTTAVYVSAFAWIGVYCSVTSRTTLIATIRAFLTAAFLAGGFWPFLALCCGVPMEMMLRSSFSREVTENLATLLLGFTPPFVMGWMPMNEFERSDMGPFHWRESSWFGPFAPVIGLIGWTFFAFVLGMRTWVRFEFAANRTKRRRRPPTPPPEFKL